MRIIGLFALCVSFLLACDGKPPIIVPIDPTFTWDAVTKDCTGTAITGPVMYNVYVIASPGPIPTITTPTAEVPCGAKQIVDKTKINPLNTSPITTPVFKGNLADGSYFWAVEAVNAAGTQGIIAKGLEFTVKGRLDAATGGTVGP